MILRGIDGEPAKSCNGVAENRKGLRPGRNRVLLSIPTVEDS
jgi:hypothetical protein